MNKLSRRYTNIYAYQIVVGWICYYCPIIRVIGHYWIRISAWPAWLGFLAKYLLLLNITANYRFNWIFRSCIKLYKLMIQEIKS